MSAKLGRERAFIDTNVLVYAAAKDEPTKQRVALKLLKRLYEQTSGVVSTQVLKEYCNVALKKLKLAPDHLRAQLEIYEQFEVVQVTPAIIRAGIDLHQTRKLAFYDALIVASAGVAACTVLYTEDMNAGERIGGVALVNPFRK
jgi:predicted nucleic acid-binding protein